MTLETLKTQLPDYAKDLKLNLSSLASEQLLSPTQRAGTFVAAAYATAQPEVIAAMVGEFGDVLGPDGLKAAKTAAALMAMNNVYYRFTHLVSAPDYKALPAKLRMNALANPGAPKVDFELWSLAVSAINGCGVCVDAHERTVRGGGLGVDAVQAAVRIAAVVRAVAATLAAESAAASVGGSAVTAAA